MQDGTGNTQETTCDSGRATCNMQQPTRSAEHVPDEMRRGTGRHTARTTRHGTLGRAPENRQRRTCDMRRRKGTQTRSNGQQCRRQPLEKCATNNRRHATCIWETATDDTQRATHNIRTTCAMQREICSEQPHVTCDATCNGQHAPDFAQHAANNHDM